MLLRESVYIGVDIGKFKHVAGFISKTLLERHQHFEHCPAFVLNNHEKVSGPLLSAFVPTVI